MAKCVALFSGGLDSMLAVRMMQEQDIEVHALNFKTVFTCCQDDAGRAAYDLGVNLTVVSQDDDYFQVIRKPEFGYGRGANPCIDCRIYMFQKGKDFMRQTGADFVISGEVVGQRPKSQKRRDLDIISHHSGLEDRLLRPLSALRMPPTAPEREGIVDRSRLGSFVGRGRKGLIRLANRFGLKYVPSPSTGCQLTEPRFSRKVFDHLQHEPSNERWAFELLRYGRHFRLSSHTKAIVGRNESDNLSLTRAFETAPDPNSVAQLRPDGFPGPLVLVVGKIDDAGLELAASLLLRYASPSRPERPLVEVVHGQLATPRVAHVSPAVQDLQTIASIPGRC